MAAWVTLDVFSGQINPTWTISDGEADKLFRRIRDLDEKRRESPPGLVGKLGYRGFHVTRFEESPEGGRSFFVYDGLVDEGKRRRRRVTRSREIEFRLLETAGDAIDEELRGVVWSELNGSAILSADTATEPRGIHCPPCLAVDAPAYAPERWNVPHVRPHNNCYNYANDQATGSFAQPGRAGGMKLAGLSCGSVGAAAQADRLVGIQGLSRSLKSGQGWYVALVIWPNLDYHWYRQDGSGCWSHKPGSTPAADVDNAGIQIADPRNCDRGPYTIFCNFMTTNRGIVLK